MKHLKQMTFTLFKELFNLQGNHYRVINEDIAALRNIAWAAMRRSNLDNNDPHLISIHDAAIVAYRVSVILLHTRDNERQTKEALKYIFN